MVMLHILERQVCVDDSNFTLCGAFRYNQVINSPIITR